MGGAPKKLDFHLEWDAQHLVDDLESNGQAEVFVQVNGGPVLLHIVDQLFHLGLNAGPHGINPGSMVGRRID